jgi:hypothetical protein
MRHHLLLSLLVALTVAPAAASAADGSSDARLRDALRNATTQLHALEDEQAQWQAKEAHYKKELEALRAEVADAKRGAARKGEDRALKQQLADQAEASAKAAAALAQCQKESGERASADAARAKERDDERTELSGRVGGLERRAADCESRSVRLVATGKELLQWLGGVHGSICEPFLKLRRVELENKAQAFEDRLLEQEGRPTGARDAQAR